MLEVFLLFSKIMPVRYRGRSSRFGFPEEWNITEDSLTRRLTLSNQIENHSNQRAMAIKYKKAWAWVLILLSRVLWISCRTNILYIAVYLSSNKRQKKGKEMVNWALKLLQIWQNYCCNCKVNCKSQQYTIAVLPEIYLHSLSHGIKAILKLYTTCVEI